jgi:hypothetical protein
MPNKPETFTSLIMPAWQPGQCYGVKIVNVAPAMPRAACPAARQLPAV